MLRKVIDFKISLWLGAALILLFSWGTVKSQGDLRSWTLGNGASFEAKITKLDPRGFELQVPTGERRTFKLEEFGVLDRVYLEARLEVQGRSSPNRVISWPEQVGLSEAPAVFSNGKDYRTEHFSFAFDRSVVPEFANEVALIFESTLKAVKAMPLKLGAAPPSGMERFEARFTDRKSFDAQVSEKHRTIAGEEVKGIYFSTKKYILLPFDSIKVRSRQRAGVANQVNSNTLIHEITHQVMHDWLVVLPYWMGEGIAEYVAMIPYNSGQFDFSQAEAGLKTVIRNRYKIKSGPIEIIHPADLFAVSNRTRWNETTEEYLSTLMLTYFFIHLDSPNTGESMSAFFNEAGRARDETGKYIADYNAAAAAYEVKRVAYNESVREYNEALARQKEGRGASVKLKSSGDGRVMIGGQASALVPPKPIKFPAILTQHTEPGSLDVVEIAYAGSLPKLKRGRDFDQLANEVVVAFKKIGIDVNFRAAKSPSL